jgi:1,3-alpha-isomaltosidase
VIRHRPAGSGHPYAASEDQRVPVVPLVGEAVELRVRVGAGVRDVSCDWDDGTSTRTLPMTSPYVQGAAGPQDGGHLAAAQARATAAAAGTRVTTSPALDGPGTHRYRFVGTRSDGRTERTRWYEVRAASWLPVPDDELAAVLTVHGQAPAGVVPGSLERLVEGRPGDDPAARTHRVRFALDLVDGEHVVGLGERYDAVDQRGRRLDAVVFEQYKAQGAHGRTYLPMPFAHVVGPRGWGLHVRTSRRTWFDVGATHPDRLVVEVATGTDGHVDLRLYDGGPRRVLDAFLAEVGRPEVLPSWVLRLWGSGNEWNTQARVEAEVARHRAEDVPLGTVVIEAWSDESTFTRFRDSTAAEQPEPHRLADFDFPPDGAWPDPKGMVDKLHADDVKVVLWQIPLLKTRPHPRGQQAVEVAEAKRLGHLVRESDGRPYRNRGWWFPLALMPDLADADARRWWTDRRRWLVADLDVDGFKTDGGEHAWGDELRHGRGEAEVRGDEGNNLFGVHYARAYGDLLRSVGKAPVTFSRAGFTGSQAHGLFWAGDEDSTWDGFRSAVRAGITAGACGILYWGWDLAGFSGDVPDAELYVRAAAASAFVPVFQYHSEFNHHRLPLRDRTPWNVAERTGDPRALTLFRRFTHCRERLLPYLQEQVVDSVRLGLPLMRGLFLDEAVDVSVPGPWEHPGQWLLGSDLLVSAVTGPGATTWATWLPPGRWVDAWTGETVDAGGRGGAGLVHERRTPWHELPVYVREPRWAELRHAFTDLP